MKNGRKLFDDGGIKMRKKNEKIFGTRCYYEF
jgi:hypothetical protein